MFVKATTNKGKTTATLPLFRHFVKLRRTKISFKTWNNNTARSKQKGNDKAP